MKDPQTLKKILIIALLPVFFIVCLGVFFLYALPTAIFEAVTSYFQSVGEEWEEGVYSAEGGIILAGIFETIKAGGRIIGDAVGGALDFVKGLWDGDHPGLPPIVRAMMEAEPASTTGQRLSPKMVLKSMLPMKKQRKKRRF